MATALNLSGTDARAPGRDERGAAGLFVYNREDMDFAAMEQRRVDPRRGWTEGDLFAVFRDDFGGLRAQYSRFEDFYAVAVTQLVRSRPGFEDVDMDRASMVHLVGLLMISRIHGYHFDNFVQLLDHRGAQLFDFRGLCDWVSHNELLFMSESSAIIEDDADDVEEYRRLDATLPATAS